MLGEASTRCRVGAEKAEALLALRYRIVDDRRPFEPIPANRACADLVLASLELDAGGAVDPRRLVADDREIAEHVVLHEPTRLEDGRAGDHPEGRLLPALLGFNLGVELGQLAIVALVWPLLVLLARIQAGRWHRPVLEIGTAMVCGLGVFWWVGRAFG